MKKETKETLSEKERRALLDFEGVSLLDIENKDPAFYYYLASKDPTHPQYVGQLERLGYETVNRVNNSGEKMPNVDMGTLEDSTDGAIQTNDMVLMRIPNELHELRLRKMEQTAVERAQRNRAEFEERVDRINAETPSKIFIFGNGAGKRR